MQRVLLALVAVVSAWAGRIDVTSEPLVSLGTGAQLEVTISAGIRPSGFAVQILGPALAGATVSLAEGSTLPYYSDYRFGAWLESRDGRFSAPLGRMLLTPGQASISGLGRGVAVLDGFSDVPAGLFGDDAQAVLRILNLGPAVEFGLGPGYTVRNSISIPGQISGHVQVVALLSPDPGTEGRGLATMADPPAEAPEPATALLAAAALCGAAVLRARLRRNRCLRNAG